MLIAERYGYKRTMVVFMLGASLAVLNVFAMGSSIAAPVVTGLLADLTGTLAYGFFFGGVVVLLGTLFILFGAR